MQKGSICFLIQQHCEPISPSPLELVYNVINELTFSVKRRCKNKIQSTKVTTTRKSLEAENAPQMAIVSKRQNLLSNTTCTPRHDKGNNLLW